MILIYIEVKDNKVHPIISELVGATETLKKDDEIIGFLDMKPSSEIIKELEGFGFKNVYYGNIKNEFHYDIVGKFLMEVLKKEKIRTVLIGGTAKGHLIGSSLAIKAKGGITAECTELKINEEDGRLIQVRPAFSGNLMAEIITLENKLQIATIREKIMTKSLKNKNISSNYLPILLDVESKLEILDIFKEEKEVDISKSKKLIIVGNGIQDKSYMEDIYKLAKLIGAEVGGSKQAVQKGLVKRENQVGLSGQTVSPDIAIIIGVSGSTQFLAGIKNIRKIVAINNDVESSILKIAHLPIKGDLYEILPKMIERLENK